MRLNEHTKQLVREAAVLGFVEGVKWTGMQVDLDRYPSDGDVQHSVFQKAHDSPDLFPLLSKVETPRAEGKHQ